MYEVQKFKKEKIMKGASTRANAMIRKADGTFKELPESAKPKHPVTTRNQGREWTQEDTTFLKELAKENTPTRVMSVKLGRSVASIRDKAEKMKLSLKPTNRSPYGTVKAKKTEAKSKSSSK